MPRERREFRGKALVTMTTMMRAGATAAQIATKLEAMRVEGASVSTVSRWMREQRGKRRARPSKKPPREGAPPATDEDDVEQSDAEILAELRTTTDLDALDRLMARAQRNALKAERNDNVPGLTNLIKEQRQLLRERRAAVREANPDANKMPDIIKLGEELVPRLLKLLAEYVAERRSAR